MLDDLFDLRAVEGLVFEQRFCDGFECVAIRNERVLGQLIGVVDEPAHFLVDLFGGRFAVIARTRNVASEENVIFVFAVFDHAHFLAHAPFANHATRNGRGASDVAARAVGDVAEDNFLRDAAAHGDGETGEQFVLAIGVFVFLRQPHGRTKRRSARDDRDLVQWLSVREKHEQQRVASFVIRGVLFFFFAQSKAAAFFAPANFVARFLEFRERDSF